MATRDEKLKKINAELEAMSDDELSMVAGGTKYETADDSRFLNSLNGSCDRYGASRFPGSDYFNEEIENAWKTVGITAKLSSGSNLCQSGDPNEYYLNGERITQEAARQHAMKVTGHYMTEKDWKW